MEKTKVDLVTDFIVCKFVPDQAFNPNQTNHIFPCRAIIVCYSELKDAREGLPGSRALDTFNAIEFISIFQKIKLSFILLVRILDSGYLQYYRILQKIKLSFYLLVRILRPKYINAIEFIRIYQETGKLFFIGLTS
jgi:hypothetical protein